MKVRLSKKMNILADTFQLTKKEIESQAMVDLLRYTRLYQQKYGKKPSQEIDIDNFTQLLWGIEIIFEEIDQVDMENEILGFLDPQKRVITIDSRCTNQARINFTIAHEAGHLSLHSYMFEKNGDGLISGWKNTGATTKNNKRLSEAESRREWQANHYAAAILAPTEKVKSFLKEKGINIYFGDCVDLTLFGEEMQKHLSLSRQALEIRLKELNIPTKGCVYC